MSWINHILGHFYIFFVLRNSVALEFLLFERASAIWHVLRHLIRQHYWIPNWFSNWTGNWRSISLSYWTNLENVILCITFSQWENKNPSVTKRVNMGQNNTSWVFILQTFYVKIWLFDEMSFNLDIFQQLVLIVLNKTILSFFASVTIFSKIMKMKRKRWFGLHRVTQWVHGKSLISFLWNLLDFI